MNVLGQDKNGDYMVEIHPAAVAAIFGLQTNDIEEEGLGILQQLKAEALESDREFMEKRLFS